MVEFFGNFLLIDTKLTHEFFGARFATRRQQIFCSQQYKQFSQLEKIIISTCKLGYISFFIILFIVSIQSYLMKIAHNKPFTTFK